MEWPLETTAAVPTYFIRQYIDEAFNHLFRPSTTTSEPEYRNTSLEKSLTWAENPINQAYQKWVRVNEKFL